jgi:hypothetical protein
MNTKMNTKCFSIYDNGQNILIKQPKLEELRSLYYVLLNNIIKRNRSTGK